MCHFGDSQLKKSEAISNPPFSLLINEIIRQLWRCLEWNYNLMRWIKKLLGLPKAFSTSFPISGFLVRFLENCGFIVGQGAKPLVVLEFLFLCWWESSTRSQSEGFLSLSLTHNFFAIFLCSPTVTVSVKWTYMSVLLLLSMCTHSKKPCKCMERNIHL